MPDFKLPKQENYETAIRMGWDDLDGADLADRTEKAGARWDPEKKVITLKFLGRDFELHTSEKKALLEEDSTPAKQWQEIILLHYIRDAKGTAPAGKIISYKEVPDAMLYWPNFIARVHNILLKAFGSAPGRLLDFIDRIGGEPHDLADVSARVQALPKVELIIQMWKGDEEFGPEASVVFDSSITDYLPAEDITVMCQMAAIELMKASFSK